MSNKPVQTKLEDFPCTPPYIAKSGYETAHKPTSRGPIDQSSSSDGSKDLEKMCTPPVSLQGEFYETLSPGDKRRITDPDEPDHARDTWPN